jgi:membrane-bound lytic murein transglycosylase B
MRKALLAKMPQPLKLNSAIIKSMRKINIGIIFLALFLLPNLAVAQATEEQKAAQEAQWRAELAATEADIAKWQGILDTTKQGTASLQNDAAILQAKINAAKATIKQRQVQIEQLTSGITIKTKTINELEAKINRGKESLSSILRSANQLESHTIVEAVLSNNNISGFFEDIDLYGTINNSLENQFAEIRSNKSVAELERKNLDDKRTAEADTKAKLEEEKKRVEINEQEKQKLITINKTQEKTYSQVIAEKEKRAAQIRAALFALRDTEGIPFGDALNFATKAGAKTGVRPALILAILTQESDLGKNQGSCLVTNTDTGDGQGKNTGTLFEKVMKAPRDTAPFLDITNRLNRDWKMTPVSCPPGYTWTSSRGYGGGMGPSQFIPSTWELFKDRLGSLTGLAPDQVNPWNPEHAIMATSLYMADLGAANSGYTAEVNAACKYYSGRSCDNRTPSNKFYGEQVLAKAQNIQLTMIDPLQGL